jgi:hypothetical protein
MKFWRIADLLLRGETVGVLQNLCFTNLRNNLSPEARLACRGEARQSEDWSFYGLNGLPRRSSSERRLVLLGL